MAAGTLIVVSAVLAELLAARRSVLNQAVADARHRWPGLDMAAFSAFVTQTIDPLCQAIQRHHPSATQSACEAAFEIGLELVAQGHAGPKARLPWVEQAWRSLAPALAPLLADAPRETLGTISNAVVRLGAIPDIRVAQWIHAMAAHAGVCTSLPELRDIGALCAWQAGMVQLRRPALARIDALPANTVAAVLGIDAGDLASVRVQLEQDRWWNPRQGSVDLRGHRVGSFSGLDGAFPAPPQVRAAAEGFVVESAGGYFLLLADAFGAVLLPASAAEYAAGSSSGPAPDVTARLGVQWMAPALSKDNLCAVSGASGIALFSPWSHHVHVLPPQ